MKNFISGGFFLEGFKPMQMLVEMALITGLFILCAHIFQKRFRPSKLSQAIGLLAVAILYLKYRVYPPMPFSVLAMYTTIIAIGIFVWVSSTQEYWKSFYSPIIRVIDGATRPTRIVRIVAMLLFPTLVGILGFNTFKPSAIEAPIELRTYNPAPPSSINVHGKDFILEIEQNPFRVDEAGTYLKPPSNTIKLVCANEFSALRMFDLCPTR